MKLNTPWQVRGKWIVDDIPVVVASGETPEHAAEIVRRVNAFDGLVAALEHCRDSISAMYPRDSSAVMGTAWNRARDALAAARSSDGEGESTCR